MYEIKNSKQEILMLKKKYRHKICGFIVGKLNIIGRYKYYIYNHSSFYFTFFDTCDLFFFYEQSTCLIVLLYFVKYENFKCCSIDNYFLLIIFFCETLL